MKKTLDHLTETEKLGLIEGCSKLSDFIQDAGVQKASVAVFVRDPDLKAPDSVKSGGFKNHNEEELLDFLRQYLTINRSSSILFELMTYPDEIGVNSGLIREVILANEKSCFAYVDYRNVDRLDNLINGITYYRPAHAAAWNIEIDSTGNIMTLSIDDMKNFTKNRVFSLASIFDDEAIALVTF